MTLKREIKNQAEFDLRIMVSETVSNQDKILAIAASLFKVLEVEDLQYAVDKWLKSLPEKVFSSDLSSHCRALLSILKEEGDMKEKFAVRLPQALDFPPEQEWGAALLSRYHWRLARARLEGEVYDLKDFFPLPDSPEQKEVHFKYWAENLMRNYNFSKPEMESILLDILENTVW